MLTHFFCLHSIRDEILIPTPVQGRNLAGSALFLLRGLCAHLAQTLACLAGETSISPNSWVDCLGLGSSPCWGTRSRRGYALARTLGLRETRGEFRDKYLQIVFWGFCNVRGILGGRRGTTCLDAWPFTGPWAPGVFRFGDNLFGSLGPEKIIPKPLGADSLGG